MPDPITAMAMFKRFWLAIPIAALLALVGWQHLQLGLKDNALDAVNKTLVTEQLRATVADGNFSRADAKITELTGAALIREAELKATRDKAASDRAMYDASFAKTSTLIDKLRSAARAPGEPCTLSPVALNALKDL